MGIDGFKPTSPSWSYRTSVAPDSWLSITWSASCKRNCFWNCNGRVEEKTAADRIALSAKQIKRLNNLTPAAGWRHDEGNIAVIDR